MGTASHCFAAQEAGIGHCSTIRSSIKSNVSYRCWAFSNKIKRIKLTPTSISQNSRFHVQVSHMSETPLLSSSKRSALDSPPTLIARATYSVEMNKYSPVGDQFSDATGYEHSSSVFREKIVSMTYTTFVSLANAASILEHKVL